MRIHLLACIALVAGCSDDDNDNDNNNGNNNDPESQALDQGNTRGQALVGQARQEFSGASDSDSAAKAAGVVTTINAGEIAEASYVLSVSSNGDVRKLASEIQADHQDNDAMLQAMMQDLSLAPADNAVSRTLASEAQMGLSQLQATPPADLDAAYVEMQVMMHQEASVIVDNLRGYVQVSRFDDFLSNTLDTIEQHRQHSIDLLRNLK
jgi:predicted outer membrane protein